MKILIVFFHNNSLNPIKGNSTRIWSLIKSLVEKKAEVTVLHSIKSRKFEDSELKHKISIIYHNNLNVFLFREKFFNDINPYLIIKLFKLLNNNNYDLIQMEYPFGFLTLKLLSKKKTYLIYDSHNVEKEMVKVSVNDPERFPQFLRPFIPFLAYFTGLYEKLVCKLANLVITVSNNDRNYYTKEYKINRKKIMVIQSPSSLNRSKSVNYKKKKTESRRKLGLPLDKTIVIFHGSLPHPPNREAFKLIENKIAKEFTDKNVIFILAGLNLKRFKRNNVISLGFVEDLEAFLCSADIAIVPIISGEGTKIKCSDYISLAIPFISTKKGVQGIEFLEDGMDFLLVHSVNDDFIIALNKLVENPGLRNEMHENLLKKSKFLNQETFGKRMFSLYSQITEIN